MAVTMVAETLTADAMNAITATDESTAAPNIDITETVAAVTASAATRAAQSTLPTVEATSALTIGPVNNNTGSGGQTLLVAILIALGLIVVAFSQATRRR